MSDKRYRLALRNWQTEESRSNWQALLQESMRVGLPIFTPELLVQSLRPTPPFPQIQSFEYTVDGFRAQLVNANNPPVERIFNVRMGLDYEPESLPLWSAWDGKIEVIWATFFEPECPGLQIIIDACDNPEYSGETFIYEGDCIATKEQFVAAMRDASHWTT